MNLDRDRDELWMALISVRERAIRVALARGVPRDDVDDVVQEALARVAAMTDVDLPRVGALVTVVVANLAVDNHRRSVRAFRAAPLLAETVGGAPDEDILDRAEAKWLWSRRGLLGDQDRQVLELRAQGLTVGETASALGVTYKAADRAFSRARARMREVWRATASAAAILCSRAWHRPRRPVAVVAVAAVTTVLALTRTPATDGFSGTRAERSPIERQRTQTAPSRVQGRWAASNEPPGAVEAELGGRARPRSPDRVEAATGPVALGGLGTSGISIRERARDESFAETVQRCLDQGVEVTPAYVGCRDYAPASARGDGRGGAGTQYVLPGQIWVEP